MRTGKKTYPIDNNHTNFKRQGLLVWRNFNGGVHHHSQKARLSSGAKFGIEAPRAAKYQSFCYTYDALPRQPDHICQDHPPTGPRVIVGSRVLCTRALIHEVNAKPWGDYFSVLDYRGGFSTHTLGLIMTRSDQAATDTAHSHIFFTQPTNPAYLNKWNSFKASTIGRACENSRSLARHSIYVIHQDLPQEKNL